ncbi:MAG TPA: tRNA dihydrouridine synthase DusB [Rhizomicrobium sp.]|nr:tRNA dihydrouridine synthase DusB [Rhizomicrobium sp.]
MNDVFSIAGHPIGTRVLLAPMSGVSDLPFRRAASRLGAAYVATEMVACETLAQGRADVVRRAARSDDIPLTVIQLVGREAHWLARGAAIAEASGADIIDINMGCPAREVTGGLSGSALMRDLDQAERLIAATVGATQRPVTLKMRLGWDCASMNAPELAARAEGAGVRAITVHGRTRQQFFNGTANWRAVAEVKAATRLPVIVNGDIVDAATARVALSQSGADAVMIGRAALGKPWIARAVASALESGGAMAEPDLATRLDIILDHFRDALAFYGDRLGLKTFRKHLARYIEDAPLAMSPPRRRAAKARLCALDDAGAVERDMIALWQDNESGAALAA